MGSDLIIVVFAVVVIGGMGSILGAIVTGLGLGIVEGLTKVFYPEASNTVIFVVMVDRAAGPARRPVRAELMANDRSTPPACKVTEPAQPRRRSLVMVLLLRRGAVPALSGAF